MKIIKNANLAKLIGITSKKDNCSGVFGATIAHLTNIKLSHVDTIEYEPAELANTNPDDDTIYFFMSRRDDKILRITKGKENIGDQFFNLSWNDALKECKNVYEVKDFNLASVYANGRQNSFDKHFESRKSTLSERLAEYKENKKIKAHDAEVDNLVKRLESKYNELYDITNAKMDIQTI
jgi:hypothetical protein